MTAQLLGNHSCGVFIGADYVKIFGFFPNLLMENQPTGDILRTVGIETSGMEVLIRDTVEINGDGSIPRWT